MPCSPFARNTPIDVNEIYARGSHAESGHFWLVVSLYQVSLYLAKQWLKNRVITPTFILIGHKWKVSNGEGLVNEGLKLQTHNTQKKGHKQRDFKALWRSTHNRM